jgi:hypothetical protein
MNKLSLKSCYAKAWKSFAKWWIPICAIAGGLMVFEWIPKQLAKGESLALHQKITAVVAAFNQGDLDQVEMLAVQLNATLMAYAHKLLVFSLYAAPFAILLTVLLLATALMATRDRRMRFAPKRIAVVSLAHLVFAIVKVLLIFFLLPLGIYVYVKLFFVSLLMLEEGKSPVEALRESWRMTEGNFWPLFGMVTINGTLQFLTVPTIIGIIPATGFANTARAAAFTMLRTAPPPPESPQQGSVP